jgi:trimeric autotransporter adhesin
MSYNGSGTFNINSAGQPVVTGTVISSTAFNALTADLGTGLSTALTKDGQTVATARIPFAAGINSSLVTDATNTATGSIITAGGVGIAKALFVGTTANIAGITTVAAGTAALPAIVSTTGTADTGLWFPAADTVAVSTAGAERMRIDSSGNVGIGTSSPSAKLQVDSSSATYSANIRARNSNFGSGVVGAANGILTVATDMNNMAFYTASNLGVDGASAPTNERMRIDTSGNLLVGLTSGNADAKVSINAGSTDSSPCIDFRKGSATTTTAQVFTRFFTSAGAIATGSITANGVSSATFTAYSDKRLKENIVDLPSQLSNIMALRPVEFDFKGYKNGEGHQLGFIAQEVQEIYPDLVGEGTDGMLTLSDMNKNDARLIKCIQEQQALILALTDRIAALEAK